MTVDPVQRRTVRVLATSQLLGGIGVATGIAFSSLIAAELSGSDAVGGLAQTSAVVGAALVALPLAHLAERHGRRRSLTAGYSLALVGALVAAGSAWAGWWPVLLAGLVLFGAGTATGLAARYAATDLARPERRATDLSVVVWATTIGSVLGPNLSVLVDRLDLGSLPAGGHGHGSPGVPAGSGVPAGPGERAGSGGHDGHGAVDGLAVAGDITTTGPVLYVVAALAFAGAALAVWTLLRPDPLLTARDREGRDAPSGTGAAGMTGRARLAQGWAVVRSSPTARLALTGIVTSHLVMVGVMVMTPVHMDAGGASVAVVGIVISAHIAAMYALSPLVGRLADRWGHARVVVLGILVLLVSAVVVAGAPGDDTLRLGAGLVLLGVGWSCGLVAGSALVVDATPPAARTAVQGVSDLAMNLGGAAGGLVAGAVVALASYSGLAWGTAVLLVVVAVVLAAGFGRARRGAPGRA